VCLTRVGRPDPRRRRRLPPGRPARGAEAAGADGPRALDSGSRPATRLTLRPSLRAARGLPAAGPRRRRGPAATSLRHWLAVLLAASGLSGKRACGLYGKRRLGPPEEASLPDRSGDVAPVAPRYPAADLLLWTTSPYGLL
jgi:hypothetical protein